MGLVDAIAASLGSAAIRTIAQPSGVVAASLARAAKPVLQLNRVPITLDPSVYRNASSGSNPRGDQRPLFAFRELVDPVPAFTRSYSPSAASTERIYETLLSGASIEGESAFGARVLNESKQLFEAEKLAYLDGSPGVWRPVTAAPEDWPTAAPERFQHVDIDLNSLSSSGGAFAMIAGDDQLELRLDGGPAARAVRPSAETHLRSLRMEYLLVGLRRSWINPLLFDTNGWFLSGEDAGFCSSGSLTQNDGVLPLIPTGLLLGRNVELSADWSKTDASFLQDAKLARKAVFLGPFLLSHPQDADSTLQVIGWTSDLVPFSPRITKQQAGSILIENSGAFVARFSVEWNEGPDRRSETSGNFPVLASKEVTLPVNASKITVKIDLMTFPAPFETWKTVCALSFEKPVVKRYELSGTTVKPGFRETSSAS
jgi:hypothetical protein